KRARCRPVASSHKRRSKGRQGACLSRPRTVVATILISTPNTSTSRGLPSRPSTAPTARSFPSGVTPTLRTSSRGPDGEGNSPGRAGPHRRPRLRAPPRRRVPAVGGEHQRVRGLPPRHTETGPLLPAGGRVPEDHAAGTAGRQCPSVGGEGQGEDGVRVSL